MTQAWTQFTTGDTAGIGRPSFVLAASGIKEQTTMAQTVNRIELIGYLGADPQVKIFDDGQLTNFSVATTRRWKNRDDDDWKEETEWSRVVTRGRLAEQCATQESPNHSAALDNLERRSVEHHVALRRARRGALGWDTDNR
jgi:hypothetical protein